MNSALSNVPECGASSKLSVSPFIVGGDIVDTSSDWPWLAAIYYAGEFSGAAIYIGDGWLVSAAHLVQVQRVRNGVRYVERYTSPLSAICDSFMEYCLFFIICSHVHIDHTCIHMQYRRYHVHTMVGK